MSKIKYIQFPEAHAWGKEESAWFLGLNIKNTYTLEVKFNAVPWNAWTQFMGCLVNNDYDEFQFSIYQNENGQDFGQNYWDYGEGRLWSDAQFPVSPNEDHVLIINVGSGDVNIDGNTYAGGGNNVSGTSYGPLWIGCAPSGFYDPGFTGRIYYLKIYENNTLIADYEAVSANNYVGFVDTVSGNYLTKGGNGTVIYGEESVTPPYVINTPAKQVVNFNNKNWPLPAPLVIGPPSNTIWYTTTTGEICTTIDTEMLPTIISNTYENGRGVVVFEEDVTGIYTLFDRANEMRVPSIFTSIWLPEGCKDIGTNAFSWIPNLTKIYFPRSIENLTGRSIFYSSSTLTQVTYLGTMRDWNNINYGSRKDWFVYSNVTSIKCVDGILPV